MNKSEWLQGFHEYCIAMRARKDIQPQTQLEQMKKFGYGIQWLVTGTFNCDDHGWAMRQIQTWGLA